MFDQFIKIKGARSTKDSLRGAVFALSGHSAIWDLPGALAFLPALGYAQDLGSRSCCSGLRCCKRWPLLCGPVCQSTLAFLLALGGESGGLGCRPCPFPGLFLLPLTGVHNPSSAVVPCGGSWKASVRRWTGKSFARSKFLLGMKGS